MCWTAVEDSQLRHAWSNGRALRTLDGELLLDVLEVFLLLGGERHGDCVVVVVVVQTDARRLQ
jgi:hypothetical protein